MDSLTICSDSLSHHFALDAWGRVIGVYDGSGTPLEESAVGNHYLWQGRWYSWNIHTATGGAGLYYFRARWYDPVTGRWLSKDPIGISGGLNQYVFCGNNPVSFRDPSGLLTLRLGLTAQAQCLVAVNINAGLAVGFNREAGWTFGLVGGAGGGVGLVGASGGGLLEITSAKNVSMLKGPSVQIGASGGEGLVFGGDIVMGLNPDGSASYLGGEFNAGLGGGLPFDIHVIAPLGFGIATEGDVPKMADTCED